MKPGDVDKEIEKQINDDKNKKAGHPDGVHAQSYPGQGQQGVAPPDQNQHHPEGFRGQRRRAKKTSLLSPGEYVV